jgi:hypothetical protein
VSVVERSGPGVSHSYEHVAKSARAGQSAALGNALLKWYEIAPEDEPVPPSVSDLARLGLADAARLGELRLVGELGFVILHRCGEDFYFLLVCTWRNENELWETVWAKDGDDDPAFRPWPAEGTHRPTFCVWELGVVWHEQGAWSRYLRSRRDEGALLAYLGSSSRAMV